MMRSVATGVLSIMLGTSAMAQPTHFPQTPPTNTIYSHGECKQDRVRFCAKVKLGKGALLDCYYNHQAQLSATCRKSLSVVLSSWEQHKIQEALQNPQAEKPAASKPASTPPKSSQTGKATPSPSH